MRQWSTAPSKQLIGLGGDSAVFAHPKLRWMLEAWLKVCRDYGTITGSDQVFFHRERPNIGFLAASVWMSGGVAIEEWRVERQRPAAPVRVGRCDLWISSADLELRVEAKHAWIHLGRGPDTAVQRVQEKLATARAEACDLQGGSGRRIGVLFATPVIRGSDFDHREDRLAAWPTRIAAFRGVALAWIKHDLPKRPSKNHRYAALGMAMLLAHAGRTA